MSLYVYIQPKDVGLAPNLTNNLCTFSCCCLSIRKKAMVGDYVMGLTSVVRNKGPSTRKISWIGQISEITNYNDFYHNPLYACKKPINSKFGDNFHYLKDGVLTKDPLTTMHSNKVLSNRDLKCNRVLIFNKYKYYGKSNKLHVPEGLKCIIHKLIKNQRGSKVFTNKKYIDIIKQYL